MLSRTDYGQLAKAQRSRMFLLRICTRSLKDERAGTAIEYGLSGADCCRDHRRRQQTRQRHFRQVQQIAANLT
jgi:hypothetical protein